MPGARVWSNLVLPGSGLLADGFTVRGTLLLTIFVVSAALALVAPALAEPEHVSRVRNWGLVVAMLTALLSFAEAWRQARRRRIDPERVRELHRIVAKSYLTNDKQARAQAEALVAAAPEEPGAHRIFALVARAAKDEAAALRAEATAAAIEARSRST